MTRVQAFCFFATHFKVGFGHSGIHVWTFTEGWRARS
jgi:hypothetical protein